MNSFTKAGTETRMLDLYKDGFDAIGAPPGLVEKHRLALRSASGLVLVYPTWWGSLPALLTGWLDQLLPYAMGVGRDDATELLSGLDYLIAVTTHGSTKVVNVIQGEPGRHFLRRSLHALCPPRCGMRWLAFYDSDRSTEKDRKNFLNRVDRRITWLMNLMFGHAR